MVRICPALRCLGVVALALALLLPAGLSVPTVTAQTSPPNPIYPCGVTTTTLTDPLNGTPLFTWEEISGAEYYKLRVCRDIGCSNLAIPEVTTRIPRHKPLASLEEGTLYWRVKVKMPGQNESDWSAACSFVKDWLAGGAYAPQNPVPSDGSAVEFFEYPIFSWSASPGAAYYKFEIFTEYGCTGAAKYSRNTIKPTHTPRDRSSLGQGWYYWKVTPMDHQNHAAAWSSPCWSFNLVYYQQPQALFPPDGSTQIFTPEFVWTAVKGAKEYQIQVNTSAFPCAGACTIDMSVDSTRYTHATNLSNDQWYYWRVRARDPGGTYGPWSPSDAGASFFKAWHLRAVHLSPTFAFLSSGSPYFSWTPVAAATRYRIQVDDNDNFTTPLFDDSTVSDPRYTPSNQQASNMVPDTTYYWRVTAQDSTGYWSQPSDTGSFRWHNPPAPALIYPPYYYDPAAISATQFLDVRTDPTVPAPVFMWDRQIDAAEQAATSYRVEVYDYPTRTHLLWYTTTQNLSLAPTVENGFTLTNGIYYWRVRGYYGGSPFGEASEWWVFRFDTLLQPYTTTIAPYFPSDGMDNVYDTPLFGWTPVQGAARYLFQIDVSPAFTSTLPGQHHEAHPLFGFYTPQQRLAPETWYWRVKALDAGGGDIGTWSAARRVVITHSLRRGYPTHCPLTHPILYDSYSPLIGQDPPGDASGDPAYDLTDLYLARDDASATKGWFLTLALPPTNTVDMYFVFYVDLDHMAGSGGSTTPDPRGWNVPTASLYRPEVAVYAHHDSAGQVSADEVYVCRYANGQWQLPCDQLPDILGSLSYKRGFYLEIKLPVEWFDSGETWLGTASVEAFTSPGPGNPPYDTVPSEAGAPAAGLTNFAAASEKVNPLYPWDSPAHPFVHYSSPALSFSKPLFRSFVDGYQVQVSRESGFTNILYTGEWSNASGLSLLKPPHYWWISTRWARVGGMEKNTLYWRVRVRHGTGVYGPWSQAVSFTRDVYSPQELVQEFPYGTSAFEWSRVEGASAYDLEYANNDSFSGAIPIYSQSPYYALRDALVKGLWYWRVKVRDTFTPAQSSEWLLGVPFAKFTYPPTLLAPTGGITVTGVPTFLWTDVITPTATPVFAAVKYRLCLGDSPSLPGDTCSHWNYTVDTTSFTPDNTETTALSAGHWYWKVATVDRLGRIGTFSAVQGFYKNYPRPVPASAKLDPVPDLSWWPTENAAYYKLEICRDPAYSNCVEYVSTDHTRYLSFRELSAYRPGAYYWRVAMCDQQNVCGPYYEDRIAPVGLVFMPLVFK